ncbi:uncharacterized protein GGS22DRAFT_167470 [Annulohypoxylon maeteangense]|uniref:uncharacterized protein n=1 Tax=Annulohypoxylon maeteangense TaxID=1927788 RepID=UPI00200890EB|nr:uncharacterized protein GGS22DRAFT_167470 [Annulohypoxylon maeteangense]KAI0883584.1 hypothetical protein GGS22DRAFT_167470 [Annulohypoxylon maeteangense]
MTDIDYYQRLIEKFSWDNKPLLLAAGASYVVGYLQYFYAIRLSLREGKSPMPFWMHLFYLAHDSTWSYILGSAATRYNEHWFLRGTSTALFVWSCLEIYCIHRALTKDREAEFATTFSSTQFNVRSIITYAIAMQLAMYAVVLLGIMLMGERCLMQWFCLTNVLIVIGPIHDYLRRGSRRGLSLGFCVVNIVGTIWTFAPFGFWVLTIPEVFDNAIYYVSGVILTICVVWEFFIVAQYPPKFQGINKPVPIW